MADPATLALVATGAGLGMQAYSQYEEGQAAKKAYKQSAAIAIAEGERAKEVYGEQAREKRREAKRLKGRQITLYAKSGVKPGIGTPLLITKESQDLMERQARIIAEHGEYAYERGVSEAGLYKKAGKRASRRAMWKVGGTAATGLGLLAGKWPKKKPGTGQWQQGWQYGRHFNG